MNFAIKSILGLLSLIAIGSLTTISAGTTSATIPVSLNKTTFCAISAPLSYEFTSFDTVRDTSISSRIDRQNDIYVECDSGSPYFITAPGGGVTYLNGPEGNLIVFNYKDADRSISFGSESISGTGNGSVQTLSFYSSIDTSSGDSTACNNTNGITSCGAGTYTGTITLTVNF